jgi:hypothetical protein
MQISQFFEPDAGDGRAPGAWALCVVAALRALKQPRSSRSSRRYNELHGYLGRGELAGEISEFCALSILALLEMSEESELAIDYLNMAEMVASSPQERAIVAETRIAHDWLQADPAGTTRSSQTLLVHDCQAAELCDALVLALRALGEIETDACRKFLASEPERTPRGARARARPMRRGAFRGPSRAADSTVRPRRHPGRRIARSRRSAATRLRDA